MKVVLSVSPMRTLDELFCTLLSSKIEPLLRIKLMRVFQGNIKTFFYPSMVYLQQPNNRAVSQEIEKPSDCLDRVTQLTILLSSGVLAERRASYQPNQSWD